MKLLSVLLTLFSLQATAQIELPNRSLMPVQLNCSVELDQLPLSTPFRVWVSGHRCRAGAGEAYMRFLEYLRIKELLPIGREERVFPVKRPYRVNRAIPRDLVQWVTRDQLDADDMRFEILNEYYRTELAELTFSARQDLTYVLP